MRTLPELAYNAKGSTKENVIHATTTKVVIFVVMISPVGISASVERSPKIIAKITATQYDAPRDPENAIQSL